MNFYVGQEVVAIRDHSTKRFKKGQEFVIQGIRRGCKHSPIMLDINVKRGKRITICPYCFLTIKDNVLWFCSSSFAPKQQLSENTYNEVMVWIEQGNEIAILN